MDGLLHLEAIPLPDRRLATTYLQARGKNPKATAHCSPVVQCHCEHSGHIHSIYYAVSFLSRIGKRLLRSASSLHSSTTIIIHLPLVHHHLCSTTTTTTIHLPIFSFPFFLSTFTRREVLSSCYSYCTKREYGVSGF